MTDKIEEAVDTLLDENHVVYVVDENKLVYGLESEFPGNALSVMIEGNHAEAGDMVVLFNETGELEIDLLRGDSWMRAKNADRTIQYDHPKYPNPIQPIDFLILKPEHV